jgi:hypothetical protein
VDTKTVKLGLKELDAAGGWSETILIGSPCSTDWTLVGLITLFLWGVVALRVEFVTMFLGGMKWVFTLSL